jgi:hypothetical protein
MTADSRKPHADSRPFTEKDFIKAMDEIWNEPSPYTAEAHHEDDNGNLYTKHGGVWYLCAIDKFGSPKSS